VESKVERKDEHWVWSKRTETVANILLLCVSVPVLVVMLVWMVHQLAAMGV
jgi:uncharacterized membrane protein